MTSKQNAGEGYGCVAQNPEFPADNYIGGLTSLFYRCLRDRPANEDFIRGIR